MFAFGRRRKFQFVIPVKALNRRLLLTFSVPNSTKIEVRVTKNETLT